MIHKITGIIDKPVRDFIYQVIRYMPLGLCVDVGAAAGFLTRRIRLAGDNNTQVVAFEPFPGNHGFFLQSTHDLDNVKLIKKAVSDQVGITEFIVPSVVKGNEPGWEKFTGYSSLGYLAPSGDKVIETSKSGIPTKTEEQRLKVETTSIDYEFAGKVIDFMKIDVQGSEAKVLAGAQSLLRRNSIKCFYLEWSGEHEIIRILEEYNYRIYDSLYVVGPTNPQIHLFEEIGFEFVEELKLSIGKVAYDLRLVSDKVSSQEAIDTVRREQLGWIQTDLIAISSDSEALFLDAVGKYCQGKIGSR
jgi:FkbM family methyltransferase